MSQEKFKYIKYQDLIHFSKRILNKIGFDKYSSNCLSKSLSETSLRGVDSHGISLLPHYVSMAVQGKKNIHPKFNYHQLFPFHL